MTASAFFLAPSSSLKALSSGPQRARNHRSHDISLVVILSTRYRTTMQEINKIIESDLRIFSSQEVVTEDKSDTRRKKNKTREEKNSLVGLFYS